ncbi:MAG: autotransporter domain-containing protein [Neisseriaceae bacterium]|nr:MAG: autotransporter domain-containing protein [Neisseriaceae bacterium]
MDVLIFELANLTSQASIYVDSSYNDFYVFGDSLNDANPATKAVGGGIFPPQSYYISMSLFGKPITGYKTGGKVIALSTSQITQAIWPFATLSSLYENQNYFPKSQIGENNLYYLAIGNNDAVMSNFVVAPFPQFDTLEFSKNLIEIRSEYAKNMLVKLGNNGKNTIITSNLIQIDLTPLFPTLRTFPRWDLVSYIDATLLGNHTHWRVNSTYELIQDFINRPLVSETIYQLGLVTDYKLRRLAQQYQKPNTMDGAEYIKYFRNHMYDQSFVGYIISPIWNRIQEHIANVISQYTLDYSNALINKYFSTQENIVFLDFRTLLLEIFNKPEEFGIDNLTIPQCSSGISALPDSICKVGTHYFYEDQKYLFGDLVHPSAYAHQMIGNYILSVLSAPVFFSSLIKHAENSSAIRLQLISSQLNPLRFNRENLSLGFSSFVNYNIFLGKITIPHQGVITKSYTSNYLNLGGVNVIDNDKILGAILNIEFGKARPYQNYQFSPHGIALDVFYQITFNNNLWFNFDIAKSYLKAKNIERTIEFSPGFNRKEEGSVSISGLHTNIKTGYDFEINQKQFISPYLAYSVNHYKNKGYQEKSNRSTAMKFGALKMNQNYISIGLQYHSIQDNITFGVDISAKHNFSDQKKRISSGLKSAPRNFVRTVQMGDKNWYLVQCSLNKKFNHDSQLIVGSSIQYSKRGKQKFNLSLGLKRYF